MSLGPRAKITVVGAGQVGATTAQYLAMRGLGNVVLVDVVDGIPQGKALDLSEATPLFGSDVTITGANDYAATAGSDVIVVTAGVARKPGMTREDLLATNARIVGDVVKNVTSKSPEAVLILVTNPLDVMTYLAARQSGFPRHRVIGMAGVLDAARLRFFIAQALHVSVQDVDAMVLGSHGDTMVPLPRYCTVNGVSLPDLMSRDQIQLLVDRTKNGGAEIVALLKQGSAFYAPAASVAVMVQSIIRDERRVLPCCVKLEGEYGLQDVYVGVPVKLGREGVAEVMSLTLTTEEDAMLKASAKIVKTGMEEMDRMLSATPIAS